MSHERSATAGIRKTATCAADASAISAASAIFPRRATRTAPPCSAAFPTIATMTADTKNSERPTLSANTSSEPTRISAMRAVTTVAIASTPSARAERPALDLVVGRDVHAVWRRSEYQVTTT